MNEKENGDRWWTQLFDRLNNLSYQEMFLTWIIAVSFFAVVYFVLSYIPGEGPAPLLGEAVDRILIALYYSVITATNPGYGDILPFGISRLFAALEAVAGLFIFAVFVTKLMSRRQDIALREVHRLTFENTFHNIRENLHTIRKDFDLAITDAESKREVSEDDYRRIAVAYEQCASILNELPVFYRAGGGFYTLDRRREDLMLEAVNRTLERVHHMLEAFLKIGIPWTNDNASVLKLRELLRVAYSCIGEWHRRSGNNNADAFEQVILSVKRIEAQLERAIADEKPAVNTK